MSVLKKRKNTNPNLGPFHFRAPSRMVWRTIRSMMQHKSARCQAALERLKVRLCPHTRPFLSPLSVSRATPPACTHSRDTPARRRACDDDGSRPAERRLQPQQGGWLGRGGGAEGQGAIHEIGRTGTLRCGGAVRSWASAHSRQVSQQQGRHTWDVGERC